MAGFRRLIGDDGNFFVCNPETAITGDAAMKISELIATLGDDDDAWYRIDEYGAVSKLEAALGVLGIQYLPGDLVLGTGDVVTPLTQNIVGNVTNVAFEVAPTEIDVTTIADGASATRLGRSTWRGTFEGILEAGENEALIEPFDIKNLISRVTDVFEHAATAAAAAGAVTHTEFTTASLSALFKLQDPDRASGIEEEILLWFNSLDIAGASFGAQIGTAQNISGSMVIADGRRPQYHIRTI